MLKNLDCQYMYQTGGLFAPMFVDHGPHGAPHRLSQSIGVAAAGPRQAFDGRDHGVEDEVVKGLARLVLLGYADEIDLWVVGELTLRGHGDGDEDAAGK